MREKLDLTRKETWRDPEKIAKHFGINLMKILKMHYLLFGNNT